MAKQLGNIYKSLKDYTGTITNTTIVLVTGGLEQLTTLAIYRCPCVDPSSLEPICRNMTSYNIPCTPTLNIEYGLSFILVPALTLFLFSFAATPKFWKVLTGCRYKSKLHRRSPIETFWTILAVFSRALVSPGAWICVSFLDGRYLACAITPLPYDVGKTGSVYASCQMVAPVRNPSPSDYFQNNRIFSQVLAFISVASTLFLGFIFYCYTRCTFPLTYYHAKYYSLYRKFEQSEIEDEMATKAKTDAEANVKKFLELRRNKDLWDRISTVFQFHRDEKQLALYSPLHEWALEEKSRLLPEINENTSSGESSDEDATVPLENGIEMSNLTPANA